MRSRMLSYLGVLTLTLPWAIGASAQAPTPTPQFAFTGFIQAATLDTSGAICTPPNDPGTKKPSDRLRGGTMTVNGITMTVPCNSIVQFPAATFSWGDLFDPEISAPVGSFYIGFPAAPVPANPTVLNTKLGLALSDNPMPFPSFEVTVNGNNGVCHAVDQADQALMLQSADGLHCTSVHWQNFHIALIMP